MSKSLASDDAKKLHESRRRMYAEAEKYRNSYIDNKTGLIDEKYLEKRVCPVCGANDSREIFKKNGGIYVCCNQCELVFLNPAFKTDELVRYYQFNNSNQAVAHASESDFYGRIYNAGLNIITNYVKKGSLLDIGCSSGFFLDVAAVKFSSYGIELNSEEVQIARSKGHCVWDRQIDEINYEGNDQFDVITLWDVFEHIKDGKAYLDKLRFKLKNGGIIFMQIPNANSLAARVMREKCNMFDGIEHVNLYDPKTINQLAINSGYRILAMQSVIDELKPLMNYLGYEDPYNGSFVNRNYLSFLSPDLILTEMMGYKLQVILSPN